MKALLYRGTPDNPAFWERALLDLPLAAAVMSVSIGPSGKNIDYLLNLNKFMSDPMVATPCNDDFHGDTDTSMLASMAMRLQSQKLYFLSGCGSNQHNQLLLKSELNNACLVNNGEDAHEMKEIVLCTDIQSNGNVKQLAAGGGHSALLTDSGELFLWGWNDDGQLGRAESSIPHDALCPVIPKLGIPVQKVALGFCHTLVIEKQSRGLYAFGSNCRGQVDANDNAKTITTPRCRHPGTRFIDIAAGLFHSAGITENGELITFGCNRFGQTLTTRWRPPDGSALVQVACGRRHTIVRDDVGRIWTMGENKYGQLGRQTSNTTCPSARLVEGFLGEEGSGCFDIRCGWSHCVVATNTKEGITLFGWGRNDKGQLGLGITGNVLSPTSLQEKSPSLASFSCGSESTMFVDMCGRLWGCGWNEHGNLGTGNDADSLILSPVTGAQIVAPPPSDGTGDILLASGGAHVLAIRKLTS